MRCAYTWNVADTPVESLLSIGYHGQMGVLLEVRNAHDKLMERFDTDDATAISVRTVVPFGIEQLKILYIVDGERSPLLNFVRMP